MKIPHGTIRTPEMIIKAGRMKINTRIMNTENGLEKIFEIIHSDEKLNKITIHETDYGFEIEGTGRVDFDQGNIQIKLEEVQHDEASK